MWCVRNLGSGGRGRVEIVCARPGVRGRRVCVCVCVCVCVESLRRCRWMNIGQTS